MTAVERPSTLENMAPPLRFLLQRENSERQENVMQIEKGTKLLKRVWKAVVYADLAVAAAALVFIFSHYFSWNVFMSNIHQQATAGTAAEPQ